MICLYLVGKKCRTHHEMNYIIVNCTFTEQLSNENGIEGIKRTQEKVLFLFYSKIKIPIINMNTTSYISRLSFISSVFILSIYIYIYSCQHLHHVLKIYISNVYDFPLSSWVEIVCWVRKSIRASRECLSDGGFWIVSGWDELQMSPYTHCSPPSTSLMFSPLCSFTSSHVQVTCLT